MLSPSQTSSHLQLLQEQTPSQALSKHFGFDGFKGDQEPVIEGLLAGQDSFVIMPTGAGKSLCYQLPALMLEGTAIIVSPLIALMKNQVDAMRGHSDDHDVAHYLNSSLSKLEMVRVKEAVATGKTKLLYVAPETLTKEENVDFLRSVRLSFFAIDEAHCISEWGHDFRPEYRRLNEIIGLIGKFPVMALTATATPKVQHDIQKNLGILDAHVYKSSFNRPNLFYEVRPKNEALKQIIQYAQQRKGHSGIIYCLSRKKVEELASNLKVNNIKAVAYHAGMDSKTRARIQDEFLMQDVDVIVATIAFGMGIDKPDVRFVMHYDIPKSLESYYQETGRAGRDGGEGRCIAFYALQDIEKMEKFLSGKPIAEREIGTQLLQDVVGYCETSLSRRKYLLKYFGEEFDEKAGPGWDMDDNTRNPPKSYEGAELVGKALGLVEASGGKHRAKFLSDMLLGEKNRDTEVYGIGEAEKYLGCGVDDGDRAKWDAVVRQLTLQGYLQKHKDQYGVLTITDMGREFLAHPEPFTLYEERDMRVKMDATATRKGGALDRALNEMLIDLRTSEAKRLKLPPYVIFTDPSLEEMATYYPVEAEELIRINGVGSSKVRKFGKPFLALIEKHLEDEGIERVTDGLVRSAVSKTGNKVATIQKIDRKMSLEDIGKAQGKEPMEIIGQIEQIVSAGTKVDINYLIEEYLDEDSVKELWDFMLEQEEDDVQCVIDEMLEDYSEDEIRLVRIKFMSDLAN
jgi:ATP-dependent DNA helicase RecQ